MKRKQTKRRNPVVQAMMARSQKAGHPGDKRKRASKQACRKTSKFFKQTPDHQV